MQALMVGGPVHGTYVFDAAGELNCTYTVVNDALPGEKWEYCCIALRADLFGYSHMPVYAFGKVTDMQIDAAARLAAFRPSADELGKGSKLDNLVPIHVQGDSMDISDGSGPNSSL